jgi:hypothetical protein
MTRRLTQTHAAGPLFDDSAARSNAAPLDIAVAAPLCTLMATSRWHRRIRPVVFLRDRSSELRRDAE